MEIKMKEEEKRGKLQNKIVWKNIFTAWINVFVCTSRVPLTMKDLFTLNHDIHGEFFSSHTFFCLCAINEKSANHK